MPASYIDNADVRVRLFRRFGQQGKQSFGEYEWTNMAIENREAIGVQMIMGEIHGLDHHHVRDTYRESGYSSRLG